MMQGFRRSGWSCIGLAVVISVLVVTAGGSRPQSALSDETKWQSPEHSVSENIPLVTRDGRYIPLHLASGTFDPLLKSPAIRDFPQVTMESIPFGEWAYYIVQMNGPITDEQKGYLIEAGVQIFDYIPEFAFIVKMDEGARTLVETDDSVRWVGLYQPGYRVAPELMRESGVSAPSGPVELTVVTFRGEDISRIVDKLEALGGRGLDATSTKWKGKIKVEMDSTEIPQIAAITGVRWIEEAPVWRLFNDVARGIMNVDPVGSILRFFGEGQVVGIADSGLDQGSKNPANLHDDFEDGAGNSRVIRIFDRVGDGANDVRSGHGTHVAGSVLGNGARSGSDPLNHDYAGSFAGVAPGAQLVFQAVENNFTGSLSGIPNDLNILFDQARAAGARIHTNSWGASTFGAYTSFSEDVDENTWDHKNLTILFAAGNDGIDFNRDGVIDFDSIISPATAKNCISVGATENDRPSGSSPFPGRNGAYGTFWPGDYPVNPIRSDHVSDDPEGMAAFSSRGPTNDGRIKPDVGAPGTNVISTLSSQVIPPDLWGTGGLAGGLENFYVFSGGTSMSTPLAAGAAALVRESYTDQGITPSSALIKATLINGATDMSGQYSGSEVVDDPRPNQAEGWGRIDLGNTLVSNPRQMIFWDISPGLNTGEADTFAVEVEDDREPLRVTLVWTDYPGSPIAGGGLVNDLDLTVIDPDGITRYPNGGSTFDRVNNVLGVDFDTPILGEYTINVHGFNVPQGPQPYALVISGGFTLVNNLLLEWDPSFEKTGPNKSGKYTVAGTLAIENQGIEETEAGTLRVYLSDNDTFEEGSDLLISQVPVPPIAAGQRIEKEFSGKAVLPTDSAIRYLIAVVEAGRERPEPDACVLDVGVDLTAEWLPLTKTGPNKKGKFRVEGAFMVKNTGNLPVRGVKLQVYRSSDDKLDLGVDEPLLKKKKQKKIRRLIPGKDKTREFNHKFNQDPSGSYLIIEVDRGNSTPETNEGNNAIAVLSP
jgi:hypothetical protein